jgi:hypothetical protein
MKELLINQIKEANLNNSPFSHYEYGEFFTDEIYSKLIQNLPSEDLYESFYHMDAMIDKYTSARYRFILNSENLVKAHPIWIEINTVLSSPEIQTVIFDKLKTDLLERFGTLDIECHPTVLLYKDKEGYKILPHTDKNKVATIQFSLPPDNSLENTGTSFYNSKNGDIHSKTKFLPRHGYGFAVSHKSWHGVEQITQNIVRDSLFLIDYQ